MSVFDFFRRIFVRPNDSVPNRSESDLRNDFRNPIWDSNEGDDSDNDFRNSIGSFSFNMYTNPLEMHRFFEQQMNEMLKNFFVMDGFQDFDSNFHEFPGIENHQPFEPFQQLPQPDQPTGAIEDSPKSIREQLLKPEFRRIEKNSDKVDTVLDGKVDANDIARALDKKDSLIPIWTPSEPDKSLVPNRDTFSFSSSRSVMCRTVRRPDGSVEREEIVKNSDGSESKTVTRSLGDHEYSITTFKDASGVENRTENFKNINPDNLQDFNKAWDIHGSKWWHWWGSERKPIF